MRNVTMIGRLLQIGWFRKLPNEEILSKIEAQFQVGLIASKYKPLAKAIAATLTHR